MEPAVAKPRGKDRWLIFLGLGILVVTLAAVILISPRDATPTKPARPQPFRSFSFPSTSMEPTLRLGERAFADMLAFDGHAPARGDIVVLTLPRDTSTTYVKRIVGLPGEKMQMKGGILH